MTALISRIGIVFHQVKSILGANDSGYIVDADGLNRSMLTRNGLHTLFSYHWARIFHSGNANGNNQMPFTQIHRTTSHYIERPRDSLHTSRNPCDHGRGVSSIRVHIDVDSSIRQVYSYNDLGVYRKSGAINPSSIFMSIHGSPT